MLFVVLSQVLLVQEVSSTSQAALMFSPLLLLFYHQLSCPLKDLSPVFLCQYFLSSVLCIHFQRLGFMPQCLRCIVLTGNLAHRANEVSVGNAYAGHPDVILRTMYVHFPCIVPSSHLAAIACLTVIGSLAK